MRESLDFAGFYARRWAFVLPKIRLLLANYMQKTYNIFRQKAHGFNRGMNATCM